ncbi:MAG: hypothetical protein JW925_10860 [Syntrophaceae bacterium]|nr:hypothetical protein [Syntrophaceae bacterium]
MIDKIRRMFFIHVDLYCNYLQEMKLFREKELGNYAFTIVDGTTGIDKLKLLVSERGEKFRQVVVERLRSGNFMCFCFIEKSSGKAAYSRWLRKGSFYHDRFKETIQLAADEAFTMDSYTPIEFRGKGLHKEMNKRMLNYCKKELKISKVYMIIFRGKMFVHLHKTVLELGYRRIRSRFYFKTDLFVKIKRRIRKTNAGIS